MSSKCDMGAFLTLEWLIKAYKEYGVAHIVTDGKYVQIEKDLSAATEKVN